MCVRYSKGNESFFSNLKCGAVQRVGTERGLYVPDQVRSSDSDACT